MATTQPKMRVASVMLRRGVRNPRNAFLIRVCGTRIKIRLFAQVMELVDLSDSKSDAPCVPVRVRPWAPTEFAFVMELVDIPD